MSAADVAQYVGLLFGAWAMGYGSGLLFYVVRRGADFI